MCNNNGYKKCGQHIQLAAEDAAGKPHAKRCWTYEIISCEKSRCSGKGHVKRNAGRTECSEVATIIFQCSKICLLGKLSGDWKVISSRSSNSPQLHNINKCNVYSKSFLRWDFSNTCVVKYLYKNTVLIYVIKNEHADRVQ